MDTMIIEMVNRETAAWDGKDIQLLLSVFHPDMVWVWPTDCHEHDPIHWEVTQGKFDYKRWTIIYSGLFQKYDLVHNRRTIVKTETTNEQDGGFAVVDIDTLWHDPITGDKMHWFGRTCKTYVKTQDGFKMIAQTGALDYSNHQAQNIHNYLPVVV